MISFVERTEIARAWSGGLVGNAAFLKRIFAAAIGGAAITACIGAASARVIEEIVEVPVRVAGIDGTPVSHTIKVTIFRDDARTRSPFLILNHGRQPSPGFGRLHFISGP